MPPCKASRSSIAQKMRLAGHISPQFSIQETHDLRSGPGATLRT